MRKLLLVVAATAIVLAACESGVQTSIPTTGAAARANAQRPPFRLLFAFIDPRDGSKPSSDLVPFDGLLYGVTYFGGTGRRKCGCGTVFATDGAGNEKVIYRFKGMDYQKHLADGENPDGGLTPIGSRLYGTTLAGGVSDEYGSDCIGEEQGGCGTVYAIDPGGREHVVYRFKGFGNADAANPIGDLVAWNGILYGVTYGGSGISDCSCGTVFSVTPSGKETLLHSFSGPDGENPSAGLTLIAGKLFGTTFDGGQNGYGTIFSIDESGKFASLYSFTSDDGGYPETPLIEVGNTIYGAAEGGFEMCGTLFSFARSGKERTLHSFCQGSYSESPSGSLAAIGSTLYGTTFSGGNDCRFGRGCGIIYSYDLKGGVESTVHVFRSAEGKEPFGLTNVGGILYGVAQRAGEPGKGQGGGTIYSFTP